MEQWLQPVWLLTLLHLGRRRLRTSAADGSRSANLYLLPLGADANESLTVYRRPPGGYNPSVSFADSPAGPAPLLPATQTFSPLTEKSTLYTREPLLLRKICVHMSRKTHISI